MRRRAKIIKADDEGGPSIEQLCRFHPQDWLTDEEQLTLSARDDDPLEHVAWRRYMDARERWREQQGLKRGELYVRLEAEGRRLFPPIREEAASATH